MVKAEKELWSVCLLSCSCSATAGRISEEVLGDFLLSGPFAFSCEAEDNVRVWTELEAERRWALRSRSAWMLSLAVSFAT